MKFLRGLSGAVAAGLVLLTIGVSVAQYLGNTRGFPGPGGVSVAVHIVGAIAAVIAQRVADHRRVVAAAAGSIAVFVITGLVLWTQWWT